MEAGGRELQARQRRAGRNAAVDLITGRGRVFLNI